VTALGKQKSWEEFGQFMEKSSTENTTQFYKALKNMRSKKEHPMKIKKAKD
jgi:hypothetical protein